jgi:hypothetical protein
MTFFLGVLTGLVIGLLLAFTPVGDAIFHLRIFLAWARGKE